MIASCIVLALAVALDGASLAALAGTPASPLASSTFLACHGAACVLAALAVPSLLPPAYRKPPRTARLFLLALTLAIPLLGILGLVLGLLPALWRQRAVAPMLACLRADVMVPLQSARGHHDKARVGDGYLVGVLQSATGRDHRLQALMSTLALDTRQAAPLLQIGLKDSDDEVRLLAYSLITRKEKALDDRIGAALHRLGQDADADAFATHRSLARDYWELAGLGNAASSAAFLLERARVHAQAGVALQPEAADLQLLLGRILLKENELDAAQAALERAHAGGVAIDTVAPYLAEIAFHRRHFSEVAGILNMGSRAVLPAPLDQLAAYWGDAQHAA